MRERAKGREIERESERERGRKKERGMEINSTIKRGKNVQELR